MPSVSDKQHRFMEATDLAYIAGLFDGEGSVSVYESWAPNKGIKRPIWIYQAQIANTVIRALDYVKDRFGGSIVKKSRSADHHSQGFVWRLCGNDAADFMRAIRPYTVIKSAQIDEALRFRELCFRPRNSRQTDAEIMAKRETVVRLKEMKRAV